MTSKSILRILISFLLVLQFAVKGFSQSKDSTEELESNKPTISVWGYLDTYFGYNFNKPLTKFTGQMVSGNDPIFSFNRNREFNLNHGIIGIKYNKDKIRASFSLHSGTYVFSNYVNEPGVFKNIYDAYIGYQLNQKLWVEAGVFTSYIGSESAISYDNLTLSRSLMADNTPYYMTGVKFIYEPSKKLTLTGLVMNGWQSIFDFDKNISVGAQAQYKPSDKVLFNWSSFLGKEPGAYEKIAIQIANFGTIDSLITLRYFNDLYAYLYFSKKATALIAFNIGLQKVRNGSGVFPWGGPNFIFKYNLNEKYAVVGRAEYYWDKHGVLVFSGTPNGFKTFQSSIGFDCKLMDKVLWRNEAKMLLSKDQVFVTERGTTNKIIMLLTSLAIMY